MSLVVLVNTNRMSPPIAPVGLEYTALAARAAGIDVELADLCLAAEPKATLDAALAGRRPDLVGITLRNVDDCFWPSAACFLPDLQQWISRIRTRCEAPICLGGVGFSIFAGALVERTGIEFGIRGDGETALVELVAQLRGAWQQDRVPGLIWRREGRLVANRPAWPAVWAAPTSRDLVDNRAYFRRGGQMGLETKRGCDRQCVYCADPLAKGRQLRLRDPAAVVDEVQALLAQGIDVLHLCDSEFNIPAEHARAVCEELIRRGLGERVRWYAYLSVLPFDADLARQMRRAGCVGINFTSDGAADAMLARYAQPHRRDDLARAVSLCRENGIAVMLDLLLGGPGETPQTAAETIGFMARIGPDCVGAGLGMRLYPGTPIVPQIAAEGPPEANPAIRRRYAGPIDLVQPTFYISAALGRNPARLIRELIAGDRRFFPPGEEIPEPSAPGAGDHNYNANQALIDAIAAGARGAYWDILRRLPK